MSKHIVLPHYATQLLVSLRAAAVALLLAGCHSPSEAPRTSLPPVSEQAELVALDTVRWSADSVTLTFIARDSSAHVRATPSQLTVQSDSDTESVLLYPDWCVDSSQPIYAGIYICDQAWLGFGEATDSLEIRRIVAVLNATVLFKVDGFGLTFRRVKVTFGTVDSVIGRALAFPAVRRAERATVFRWCDVSDILPPPPCPPWKLQGTFPIARSAARPRDGVIELTAGQVLRLRYQQPTGTLLSDTIVAP
jgi:hypothetical protein